MSTTISGDTGIDKITDGSVVQADLAIGVATTGPASGTIMLQNDSDGKGDYIAKWENPTLPKPTDEQLA